METRSARVPSSTPVTTDTHIRAALRRPIARPKFDYAAMRADATANRRAAIMLYGQAVALVVELTVKRRRSLERSLNKALDTGLTVKGF